MKYNSTIVAMVVLLSTACSNNEIMQNSNAAARNNNAPSSMAAPAAKAKEDPYRAGDSNAISTEERERDYLISAQIGESLAQTGLCDVRVTAKYGQVVLYGSTDTESEKAMAETIAKRTASVVDVNNQILVSGRPPVNVNKRGGPKQKCF
jgi:osmotically-inducible protein OsmY